MGSKGKYRDIETVAFSKAVETINNIMKEYNINIVKIDLAHFNKGHKWDIELHILLDRIKYKLAIEVKSIDHYGRIVQATRQLEEYKKSHPEYYFILMAPFIGDKIASLDIWNNIGYIDFSGNCKFNIGGKLIVNKQGKPRAVKYWDYRTIRNINTAGRTQNVINMLKEDINRKWKTMQLAKESDVSRSLCFKVVESLKDEKLLSRNKDGYLEIINKEVFKDKFNK